MTIAVYPGTFDPFTNGHKDLVIRAINSVFSELHVCVVGKSSKDILFDVDQRVDMVKDSLQGIENVHVSKFEGLLVDYAESVNAKAILRGLRAVSDFEYEFQMASMNRQLNVNLESVFLTPSEKYAFISSSLVKEVSKLGGDVSAYVSKSVLTKLQHQFS